jgi:hypothetical protein
VGDLGTLIGKGRSLLVGGGRYCDTLEPLRSLDRTCSSSSGALCVLDVLSRPLWPYGFIWG